MNTKHLITGGIKSGKSRFALKLAESLTGKRIFIATAEAFDTEMELRITRHKEERGDAFELIEEPLYLAETINDLNLCDVILVDCLTVWLNNLFYHFEKDQEKIDEQIDLFLQALAGCSTSIVMITNETGLGTVPDNKLSRKYIDKLGILNQKTAAICDEVTFMVAGCPTQIKGALNHVKLSG